MSERQAKKLRKEAPVVAEHKKPADKSKVLFNAIAVVLVVAVAALAGVGIWNATKPEVQTLAMALEEQGTTFDAAVTDWALDPEVFSADMPSEDASMLFTLENMAKMEGKEPADYVKELGLPEDTATNVPSKDLPVSVMIKVSGLEMTVEDLREFGLSEEITDDTPWGEAQEEVVEAVYAAMMVPQEAAEEAPAEGEE